MLGLVVCCGAGLLLGGCVGSLGLDSALCGLICCAVCS